MVSQKLTNEHILQTVKTYHCAFVCGKFTLAVYFCWLSMENTIRRDEKFTIQYTHTHSI